MAETISRKEWSDRIAQDKKNLELRLEEIRLMGTRNDEYSYTDFTKYLIKEAITLLEKAEYFILGFELEKDAISVFDEGEENEQQETSNTSEAEGTPPRKVNARHTATLQRTFSQNGSPSGPKTSSCRVRHTTNRRTEAPNILEMKKNQAPVL